MQKLDKSIASRIVTKIKWLAENLDDIKLESLSGEFSHLFKLRIGDYRVLYGFNKPDKMIIIHLIGHRSEIYK